MKKSFPELKEGQDIPREYKLTLVDATPGTDAPTWCVLGDDLDDLKTELSANVDKKKNVLGEEKVRVISYEATDSVDPYYARMGDKLYDLLHKIVVGRLVLDDCKTTVMDVYLYSGETDTYEAYTEECVIEVKSDGGNTDGLAVPFDIHRTGNRTKGTFSLSKKAFTATV